MHYFFIQKLYQFHKPKHNCIYFLIFRDDVCILSASGTAAAISQNQNIKQVSINF